MIEDLPNLNTSNCQKYHTSNFAVRWMLKRFLKEVLDIVAVLEPSSVADLGCGEGVVARLINRRLPSVDYLGLDTSEQSIEAARSLNPDLRFDVRSLFDGPRPCDQVELVLCLEVVEHLPDPDRTVSGILSWTRSRALISVPWEPFFRLGNLLRGRHLQSWGDHPEHIHHFGKRNLRQLLERHGTVERMSTSFPWILALIHR